MQDIREILREVRRVQRREEVLRIGEFAAPDVPARRVTLRRVSQAMNRSFFAPSDSNFQVIRGRHRRHAVAVTHLSLRLRNHGVKCRSSGCLYGYWRSQVPLTLIKYPVHRRVPVVATCRTDTRMSRRGLVARRPQ